MEKTAAVGNSCDIYRLVRNSGLRNSNISNVIMESNGTLIHSQDRRVAHWTEHNREQFSWLTATVVLSLMPPRGPLEADTSPPSEMEMIREIDFPKTF